MLHSIERCLVPRTLNRPQMYATTLGCSRWAVFSSILSLVAFQHLHQIVNLISRIKGLLQSWIWAALHCRSRLLEREASQCLLKQRLIWRQASRHWQRETLSKGSWPKPGAAILTNTLSLFCFCGRVTSKMLHGVNKKLHYSACSCPRQVRIWGRSQNTARHRGKKLCIIFLCDNHCMLAVWALETWAWTWWPHIVNFRLDALIVVLSGSESYSWIWSRGERGGGFRDWTELTAGVNFIFSSISKDMWAEQRQARLKRASKCKLEESDNGHRRRTSSVDPLESNRVIKESFKDQRWAWEESVRAEKRDRDAERERERKRRFGVNAIVSRVTSGFPACLFLASPLRERPTGAQWRQGGTFLLDFCCLNHTASSRKAFHGFQMAKLTQRNTNCQHKYF